VKQQASARRKLERHADKKYSLTRMSDCENRENNKINILATVVWNFIICTHPQILGKLSQGE
jgi:hypothetical protein